MKKTFLSIAIVAFILSSCNNNKKEVQTLELKTVQTEIVTSEELEETQVLNNNWMNDIQLDNGTRWTANEETTIGVQQMTDIIDTQATITLDDYHNLAGKLKNSKDYVIKECTMKGPSHDNLHVWLLPLMEKLDALEEAKTIEEASDIKESIVVNINKYHTYFQ